MGGKSSNSTSTISIPPEVLAQYRAVNARANQVDTTPFQKYSTNVNDFVAPLNQTQNAGIANTSAAANQAQPYYGAATGYALAGGQNVDAQQIGGQQIANFQNPYTQYVAGNTAALLNQNNQQAMAGQTGNAINQGAFGGDRAGIAAAVLQGQQQLAAGNTLSGIYSGGFDRALAAAQQQQGVNLSAGQANRQALQQTGQSLAGLGAGAQTAALQGAQAQLAAGQTQQQTEQAGKSALYKQFQQEQSLPYQQLQQQANIAEAIGANSGSTTTSSQQLAARGGAIHKAGGGLVGNSEGGVVHPGHYGEGYAGGGLIGGYGESPFLGYDPAGAYQSMYGGMLAPDGAGLTGGMGGINIPSSGGGSHQLAVAKLPEPLQNNSIEKLGNIAGAADKIGQFGDKAGLFSYGSHPKPAAHPAAGASRSDVAALTPSATQAISEHPDIFGGSSDAAAIKPNVESTIDQNPDIFARGGIIGGMRLHRADGGPTGTALPYADSSSGLDIPDDQQHGTLMTAKTAPGQKGPTGGQKVGGIMKGIGGIMSLIPGLQPIGAGLTAAGGLAGAFARGGDVPMPEDAPDDTPDTGVDEDPIKRLMRKLMAGEDDAGAGADDGEDSATKMPDDMGPMNGPSRMPAQHDDAAHMPMQHADAPYSPADASPIRGGRLDPEVVSYLKSRGLPDYLALGIAAGISAESGNRLGALNPTSHALGLGQWLGARKQHLLDQYGASPSKQQQLDYLLSELHGGDPGGRYVLAAQDPRSALQAYITRFMRPAAGAETEGDIRRGLGAMQAGYASGGLVGRKGYAAGFSVDGRGGQNYYTGNSPNSSDDDSDYAQSQGQGAPFGNRSPDVFLATQNNQSSNAEPENILPQVDTDPYQEKLQSESDKASQPTGDKPDLLSGPKNFIHGLGHGDTNSWLSLLAGIGGMAGPYSFGTQLLRGLGAGAAAGERARTYGLEKGKLGVEQQRADTEKTQATTAQKGARTSAATALTSTINDFYHHYAYYMQIDPSYADRIRLLQAQLAKEYGIEYTPPAPLPNDSADTSPPTGAASPSGNPPGASGFNSPGIKGASLNDIKSALEKTNVDNIPPKTLQKYIASLALMGNEPPVVNLQNIIQESLTRQIGPDNVINADGTVGPAHLSANSQRRITERSTDYSLNRREEAAENRRKNIGGIQSLNNLADQVSGIGAKWQGGLGERAADLGGKLNQIIYAVTGKYMFNPADIGAAQATMKDTQTLANAMGAAFGRGHGAGVGVIQSYLASNPGLTQSPEGFARIVGAIRQGLMRENSYSDFEENYLSDPKNASTDPFTVPKRYSDKYGQDYWQKRTNFDADLLSKPEAANGDVKRISRINALHQVEQFISQPGFNPDKKLAGNKFTPRQNFERQYGGKGSYDAFSDLVRDRQGVQ